jgi:enamine deaminase RidA (YjgF/YER057c/UK114 family)
MLSVRAFPRADGRADYYLTAAAAPGLTAGEAARRVYSEICATIAAQGLEPVQEKIYGLLREQPAVWKARESALRDHGLAASLPASYVEGRPASGDGFAGVQLWAVRAGRSPVATVRQPWGLGRLWSDGRRSFLSLSAIAGTAPDGTLPPRRSDQARLMFRNAQAALRLHGFEFAHVVRTWIYLRDILDWYGEFNRVRSALYRRPDFYGLAFRKNAPASTGIGARCGRGACVMDLLALRPGRGSGNAVAWIRRSSRQGPAPCYGSAFSRGVAIVDGPRQTIHVSGTASIDAAGASVGLGDPEQQSLQTLLNVAALIAERGAGLEDICTSVLFCKDRRSYDAFLRVCRLLRLPALPAIALLADVCRPELQVELEAVAVRDRGRPVRS